MPPHGTADPVEIAQSAPVTDLLELVGRLAQATAIVYQRLLAPASTTTPDTPQLVDRREAAHILGVSTFYLEGKYLPCQQRAGRKILYERRKLEQYIRQGHVPYQNRHE